ncbi:MAG: sigma-70 family RNA polymerase sigma factor [Bryobacterales bacterium]|nr:sigma-70 family RNA polymerase sigma factor [Bryobacterales bacterium]
MARSGTTDGLSPEALQQLLASRQQFLGFLKKRVGSEETAEDILQAAFVKGLERGGSIREDESAVAWFYRLLRNAVIDHYRQRGSSIVALERFAAEMESHEEPDIGFRGEICECITGVMATLKPEYQQALDMVELQERSLSDLAAIADITGNNAAVRVHRAREALRSRVEAACGLCAKHGCIDCSCGSHSLMR